MFDRSVTPAASEWDQITLFRSLGLHWSSPESGDLWREKYDLVPLWRNVGSVGPVQGYLAHKKQPPSLELPKVSRHRATAEFYGGLGVEV